MSDGEVIIGTKLDEQGFERGLKNLESTTKQGTSSMGGMFSSLGDKLNSIGKGATSIGNDFSSLGNKLLPISAVVGGIGIAAGKTALSFLSLKEKAGVAFTTLLGSGQKSKQMLDDLYTFAKTTPFPYDSYLTAGQTLVAMGVNAKDTIPYLQAITDAAIGTGKGKEGIDQITEAIGKMSSRGKISLHELNMLTMSGIPAVKILANQYGKTEDEMYKMISTGSLLAKDTLPKLIDGMNQGTKGAAGATAAYGGMAEKMKGTLSGAVDSFKSKFRNMSIELLNADKAYPDLIKMVNAFTDSLEALPKVFSGIQRAAQPTLKAVSSGLQKFNNYVKKADPKQLEKMGKTILQLAVAGPILKVVGSGFKLVGSASALAAKATAAYTKVNSAAIGVAAANTAATKANAAAKGMGAKATNAEIAALSKSKISLVLNTAAEQLNGTSKKASAVAARAKGVAEMQSMNASKVAAAMTMYGVGVEKAKTVATNMGTVATARMTVAQRAQAVSATVAMGATRGLAAAMTFLAANPVMAAIAAIGLLAVAYKGLSAVSKNSATAQDWETKAIDRTIKKSKELTDTLAQNRKQRQDSYTDMQAEAGSLDYLQSRFAELNNTQDKTIGQKMEMASVVRQLNELLPELNLKYNEEKDKLSGNTKNIADYIAAKKEEMMADAAAAAAKEAYIDKLKAEQQQEEDLAAVKAAQKDVDDLEASGGKYRTVGHDTQVETEEYKKALGLLKETEDAANRSGKAAKKAGDEFNYYSKKISEVKTVEGAKKALDSLAEKMKVGGKKAINALKKSLDAGKLGPQQAVEAAQLMVNFNTLYKKSSSAGKKAMNALKAALESGKPVPAKVVKQAIELAGKGGEQAAKKGGKSGKTLMDETGKGVDKGKKNVSTKTKQATSGAINAGQSEAGKANTIGAALAMGIAAGISSNSGAISSAARAAVSQALAAAKAEGDIHSPSRKWRNQIGKMLVAGITAGVKSGKGELNRAIKEIMADTLKAAKSVNGNYDEIGSDFMEALSDRISRQQDDAYNRAQNVAERKLAQTKKQQEKEEDALKKKIKKASGTQKTAYEKQLKAMKAQHKKEYDAAKKASSKMLRAYSDALRAEQKKILRVASKTVEKLANEFQKKYDELISKREDMANKLLHTGDLLSQATGSLSGYGELNSGNLSKTLDKNIKTLTTYGSNLKTLKNRIPDNLMEEILKMGVVDANAYMKKLLKMEDGKFDEYVSKWNAEQAAVKAIEDQYLNKNTLGSLTDDIEVMKKYQANLTKLKGKIPDSLTEEILGMDITQANAYMDSLRNLTDKEFNAYIKSWKEKDALSKKIAKNSFASDIANLKENFSTVLNKEMKKVQSEMKKAGVNVIKALSTGMKSQTAGMSKVVKDICNAAIKQAKKTLQIKSPSRPFRAMGKNTIGSFGLGQEDEAPKTYKKTKKIAEEWTKQFAENINIPQAYARMKAAVEWETSQIPTGVQMKIIQTQQQQADSVAQQREYVIPITFEIDGKALVKQTIRLYDNDLGEIQVRKERG